MKSPSRKAAMVLPPIQWLRIHKKNIPLQDVPIGNRCVRSRRFCPFALTLARLLLLVGILCGIHILPAMGQEQKEPLTLEEAVARALGGSSLVKAAGLDVEVAEIRSRSIVSNYLPKVNFDYSFTQGNNPVYVFGSLLNQRRFTAADFALDRLNYPNPLSNFQNKFSLNQLLFDGGRTRNQRTQSRLGQQMTDEELRKTQSDLIFRVVRGYLEAILAKEMVSVSEDAVKSAAADEQKVANLFQQGLVVESDLLSVQVHHAAQLEELVRARNHAKLALANLNFEMGIPLDQAFELTQPLKPFLFENQDLKELQELALTLRPDFKQARLSTQANEAAIGSAKSEFWPTISAFGSWQTDDQNFTSADSNSWLVGINMRINLFNGRENQSHLAEARLMQKRQTLMQEHLAQAIRLQVEKAYLDVETATGVTEVNQKSVSQAEESLRIVRNRYQSGLTTITELLRAEGALTRSRASYLRSIFEQRISVASLELQVGRLSTSSKLLRE
ncbi:MAG: TolC family protein [Terriglobia bacterium]